MNESVPVPVSEVWDYYYAQTLSPKERKRKHTGDDDPFATLRTCHSVS
jgi:hypothetical protein